MASGSKTKASPFSRFLTPAPSEYDVDKEDDFGDAITLPEATYMNYSELEKTAKGAEKATLRQVSDSSPHISLSHGKYAGKRGSRNLDTEEDAIMDEDEDDGEEETEEGDDSLIWREGEGEEDEDEEDVEEGEGEEDGDEDEEGEGEGEGIDAGSDNEGADRSSASKQENGVEEGEGEGDGDDEEGLDGSTVQSQRDEMVKATHTRNQLQLWDDIMSIRMLLQPELGLAVQFPQTTDLTLFKQDPEIKEELSEVVAGISTTLEALIKCRVIDHCGNILDKWSGRMQVSSGKVSSKKFQSFNQGFMAQIEGLFSDRDRLVKRTTRVKKGVTIFGKDNQEEYDDEIYDDTEFYQSLLKDLIANGSIGWGTQEHWKEMSQVKRAKTRQQDGILRPASKGRTANYSVQDKLLHFMAPDDRPLQCDWNLDDLFNNLFGGRANQPNVAS